MNSPAGMRSRIYCLARPETLPDAFPGRIIAAMLTQVSAAPDLVDSVRRTLEVHGIRPTAQRIRMAEVMLAAPCHMTAEQVLAALRRSEARVSKATVYNTLKLFVERGLVRQVNLDPDRCVYDSTREPHHHFQNLDTGEMIDIRPDELSFARMPSLPPAPKSPATSSSGCDAAPDQPAKTPIAQRAARGRSVGAAADIVSGNRSLDAVMVSGIVDRHRSRPGYASSSRWRMLSSAIR